MVKKYNNLKGIIKNVVDVTKEAAMLNLVVSDWPTSFSNAFNKGIIQRVVVDNIEKNINMTIDTKLKEALTSQLEK